MAEQRAGGGPIDLHTHSRVSDGTEAPSDLVRAAAAAGLGTVALTDHDTTAGWADAASAVEETGVTVIGGIELSTRTSHHSVHMLGYLVDPESPPLKAEMERIRTARLERAQKMVRLIAKDYPLDWEDVLAQTRDGATVGRPHIADALVARGHAPDRSAVFAGILHWESGYYVPHYAPDPLTGVELIRAAGGVPVLAHPATHGPEAVVTGARLRLMVAAGLFGLEIDHRLNTEAGKVRLRELSREFGLAVTGSSDYHGAGKPNRLGEHTTAPAVLASLIAEASGTAPFAPRSAL